MLIIGDAGYSRYYKNGLESALTSAQIAARSIFESGISKEALENYYYPLCEKMFITDNLYGRILFKLNHQWNMFTGHESYKDIFWNLFEPGLQLELVIEVMKEILERLRKKCRLTRKQ